MNNHLIEKLNKIILTREQCLELHQQLTDTITNHSNKSDKQNPAFRVPLDLLKKPKTDENGNETAHTYRKQYRQYYQYLDSITQNYLTKHHPEFKELYKQTFPKRVGIPLAIALFWVIFIFFGRSIFPFLFESDRTVTTQGSKTVIQGSFSEIGALVAFILFAISFIVIFYCIRCYTIPFSNRVMQLTDQLLRKRVPQTFNPNNTQLTLQQGLDICQDLRTFNQWKNDPNKQSIWKNRGLTATQKNQVVAQYLNCYNGAFQKKSNRFTLYGVILRLLVFFSIASLIFILFGGPINKNTFILFAVTAGYGLFFWFVRKQREDYLQFVRKECEKLGCRLEKDG